MNVRLALTVLLFNTLLFALIEVLNCFFLTLRLRYRSGSRSGDWRGLLFLYFGRRVVAVDHGLYLILKLFFVQHTGFLFILKGLEQLVLNLFILDLPDFLDFVLFLGFFLFLTKPFGSLLDLIF